MLPDLVDRALGWLRAPEAPIITAAAAALRDDAGGVPFTMPRSRTGPGTCFAAALPRTTQDALLCAVTLAAELEQGDVAFRLLARDGTVLDEVVCSARPTVWNLALFAPGQAGLRVVGVPVAGAPRVRSLACTAWTFDAAALAPAALAPNPPLTPMPHWSRVYGTPDREDAIGRLRERIFAALPAVTPIRWIDGLETLLEPGDELSRAVMLSGLYEPETMCVIRDLLPQGGVFVDVGAHCGMFTLYAARHVGPAGRVIAFEPSGREFARLQAQIAHNRLSQVEVHRAAVAEAPGTVLLRLAEPGHAGHNTIGTGFAYSGVRMDRIDEVPATTLDIALAGLSRCDVIKMDVEGAELRALAGAEQILARFRPTLVLEVFDAALAGCGATVDGLLAWCTARGYRPYDIEAATACLVPARIRPGESRNIVFLPTD